MTTPELNRQRRIDWPRIVSNLQKVGMSVQDIADTVEVSKATVFSYIREDCPAEPAYYVGHSLVALWCARTGYALADVPIREVPLSVSAMLKAMN